MIMFDQKETTTRDFNDETGTITTRGEDWEPMDPIIPETFIERMFGYGVSKAVIFMFWLVLLGIIILCGSLGYACNWFGMVPAQKSSTVSQTIEKTATPLVLQAIQAQPQATSTPIVVLLQNPPTLAAVPTVITTPTTIPANTSAVQPGEDPDPTIARNSFYSGGVQYMSVGAKSISDAQTSGSAGVFLITETRTHTEPGLFGAVIREYSVFLWQSGTPLQYQLLTTNPSYSEYKVYYTLVNTQEDGERLKQALCKYADMYNYTPSGTCLR